MYDNERGAKIVIQVAGMLGGRGVKRLKTPD